MAKNYYDILGVSQGASESDIKKSYKKLAMQWHPDRHKGDKKAEEKFKEINEAYQILGDKEKRQKYDTFGTADFGNMGGGSHGFQGFDFGDIFSTGSRSGQSFEFDLGDLFGSFGGSKRGSHRSSSHGQEEGLDMEQTVELPIWDFLLGTKISIESPYSGKFRVTVPECTKPGTRLKVTGKGKTSGKHTGDLYLKLDARMPNKLTSEQRNLIQKIVN